MIYTYMYFVSLIAHQIKLKVIINKNEVKERVIMKEVIYFESYVLRERVAKSL